MADTKCSCSNGRTYLIDPNCTHGHDATNNLFIPPEDLNIYVELTTSKKARSVIDVTSHGTVSSSSTKGNTKISFIDGTNVGEGKKALTTAYTELTTVLNGEEQTSENFGISSIDVDFNSAYAPLIKIEFIDVRGSSLFNTDSGSGPESQYSSFFDLPYPIFELKIKGYYGKTVKYCLHLTKWNAKFNSKTGNFEISADFIGYTYAMLTDMLLGYLRAVVKTPRGVVKFEAAKAEMNDPNKLITIGELLTRTDKLNTELKKVESENTNVQELSANKGLLTALEDMNDYMDETIRKLTKADDSSNKGYVEFKNGDVFGFKSISSGSTTTDVNTATITRYQTSMGTRITNANKLIEGEDKLDPTNIARVAKSINYIPKNLFDERETSTAAGSVYNFNFVAGLRIITTSERDAFFNSIPKLRNTEYSLDWYSFEKGRAAINSRIASLEKSADTIKEDIGRELRDQVIEILGFEPTIKNIMRIFTVHSEIFLECLKDVSTEAESDVNKLRAVELNKLHDDLDIHKTDSPIYPWPLYREESETDSKNKTLEEAWIGKAVDIPQNVPEIVFVEELMKGLLQVNKEDTERQEAENVEHVIDSWYPVNPMDTPLFGVEDNPYKTKSINESSNRLDILKLMMMRGFVFMGLSNRASTKEERNVMARLEANAAYAGIHTQEMKDVLFDVSTQTDPAILADEVINSLSLGYDTKGNKLDMPTYKNGVVDKRLTFGKGKSFLYEFNISTAQNPKMAGDYYGYQFIWGGNKGSRGQGQRLIPMNGDYGGGEFYGASGSTSIPLDNKNFPNELTRKSYRVDSEDGLLILAANTLIGDYSSTKHGAIHLKIFSDEDFLKAKSLVPNFPRATDLINSLPNGGATHSSVKDLSRTIKFDESTFPNDRIFGDSSTTKFPYNSYFLLDYNIDGAEHDVLQSLHGAVDDQGTGSGNEIFYINTPSYGGTFLAKKSATYRDYVGAGAPRTALKHWEATTMAKDHAYGSTNDKDLRTGNNRWDQFGSNRELMFSAKQKNDIEVGVPRIDYSVDTAVHSLFGSKLYFEQRRASDPNTARGYLFLHTFPFNDLFNSISSDNYGSLFNSKESNIFPNLFGRRAGFIQAPKLWCAWIGAILWRYDKSNITWIKDGRNYSKNSHGRNGGSGKFDPIHWGKKTSTTSSTSTFSSTYVANGATPIGKTIDDFPLRNQFCTHLGARKAGMNFSTSGEYKNIGKTLQNLPGQIKAEFRKIFHDFVQSEEWETIREGFEIHPKTWDNPNTTQSTTNVLKWKANGYVGGNWEGGSIAWDYRWRNSYFHDNAGQGQVPVYKVNGIIQGKKITDPITNVTTYPLNQFKDDDEVTIWRNHEQFSEFGGTRHVHGTTLKWKEQIDTPNYQITYRIGTELNKRLVNLFTETLIIANCSYKPWVNKKEVNAGAPNDAPAYILNNSISDNKINVKGYINSFISEFIELNDPTSKTSKENEQKQELFNTMDDDAIRLNIYRHCKAIYDKWIAGSSGNIMTACGSGKKALDVASMNQDRNSSEPRLIDSFRFVNRAMNDIGDDYIMNPNIVKQMIYDNPNQSFYDLISKVLSDNNFNFIALPTFIDYEDPKEMSNLFKAQIHNETLDEQVSGPTFVCVYVGQSSNKLDLGKGSDFPNDGFDFHCEDGQLVSGEGKLPADFTKQKSSHEHNVVAFAVNYGHQNQNIFTDVKLDQQEFSETDESLQITDSIANNAGQSNRTLAGQNLWNVYQVRAYSTTITAMGNAMIQPMMYFQLNNIPMFHGGYQIINVKHNIIPNHMKTTFKGVRTRWIDTPLIEANTLYMSMLGTIESTTDGSGRTTIDRKGGSGGNTINHSKVDNSGGLYVHNSSGLKTYVFNRTYGFAGKTLTVFMGELEKYLQSKHPEKKITLGSNGITRSLEGVTKGGKSRSTTSKHGSGLAIDISWHGLYGPQKTELQYYNDKTATGCRKTDVKCYTWYAGNKIVVSDIAIMKSIRTFVDTTAKWKDLIRWGADFTGEGEAGRTTIDGWPVRIDEMHHFEIKDGKFGPYVNPHKKLFEDLGLKVPTKQSDLAAIYAYPYSTGSSDVATVTREIKKDGAKDGDGAENETPPET